MGDYFRPFFKKGKRTLSRINATAPLNKGAKNRGKIEKYALASLIKGGDAKRRRVFIYFNE